MLLAFGLPWTLGSANVGAEIARGVVFHDQNGNGARESNEPGIANIRVSNGLDIVSTNAQGNYELAIDDEHDSLRYQTSRLEATGR